jgi:general secretion pathway protein A
MNNAGFTVITGEIGSGKTTLVRHLLKRISPNITTGLISNSPQGRHELMQWIMMALGQSFEGDYPTLFKRFQDLLHVQYASRHRTVLIIDEAQNLGTEALEHLRMLSNINADKHQILQLILIGQPQLRDLLLKPELHQFVQRISSDFHLRPLEENEVARYIDFRLRAVGATGPIFTEDACLRIARASGGVPRTINILCDTALVYGFSESVTTIGQKLVEGVIVDKQRFSLLPLKKPTIAR